jgi:phage gp29-like protein
MLVSPSPGLESPRDRRRYAARYSTGLTPATMASIFACADQGDLAPLMELEQELTKDELIGSYLDTRLGSLSQRDLVLKAPRGEDPKRGGEVVAFCQEILSGLRFLAPCADGYTEEGELPEIVEAVDGSFFFGMTLPWIYWDTPRGVKLPRPVAVELLDQRRYRTKPDTNEVLLESKDSWMGQPLSDFDPWNLIPCYGRSLSPRKEFAGAGRAVAFAFHLRSQARLYSLGYAERFAIPAVVGTFEGDADAIKAAYNDENLEKLQRFVESFMSDAAGLFPPGFKVAIVGATQGGEKLFEYLEACAQRAISTAIHGQDGTSSGQGGSLAKAGVNEISRQDLIRKGGRRVASWFRRLLGYAVELEYGPEVPAPVVTFGLTPEEQAEEDAKRLESAQKLGLPVALDYALNALGLPEPEDGAVLLDGTLWDGKEHRRRAVALSGKDLAQALSAGIYPLVSGLNGGLGIDVPKVAAALGLPLDPTKEPYTPPAVAGEAPAAPAAPAQEPTP